LLIEKSNIVYYLGLSKIVILGTSGLGDISSIYIKILINYLQIVSLVKEMKIDFSDLIMQTNKLISPVEDKLYALDCMF
jgi:hypothetical protein